MKKDGNVFYGFEGLYEGRILDFELPSITEQESRLFCAEDEGIRVTEDAPIFLTVVRIENEKRTSAEIDISSACQKGKRVCLRLVLSTPPKLFAYTDKKHSGSFPLPLWKLVKPLLIFELLYFKLRFYETRTFIRGFCRERFDFKIFFLD